MFLLGVIFLHPLTACVVSLLSRRLLWGGSWASCPAQWSLPPCYTISHTHPKLSLLHINPRGLFQT